MFRLLLSCLLIPSLFKQVFRLQPDWCDRSADILRIYTKHVFGIIASLFTWRWYGSSTKLQHFICRRSLLNVSHQRGQSDQVFGSVPPLRVEMDGVTGVGGGGQWARFVRPLTPEAHADERLGGLQVVILDARLQLHGRHLPAVHSVNLRTTGKPGGSGSRTNRNQGAESKRCRSTLSRFKHNNNNSL